MTSFLRRASHSLPPQEAQQLEPIRKAIEQATSEILINPDWGANLVLCDAISACDSPAVVREAVRLLRKRLQSSTLKVVLLSLTLVESLVMNCQAPLHREVATDKFMQQMAKVAKVNSAKRGRENLEVAEKAWGEAFLPHRGTMPLFAQTYEDLRRRGMRFPRPVDDSAPIFTPPPVIPGDDGAAAGRPSDEIDAATAAAIAAAAAEDGRVPTVVPTVVSAPAAAPAPAPVPRLPDAPGAVVDVAANSAGMLASMIEAAASPADLARDDVAQDLLAQCRQLQDQLPGLVERAAMGEGAGFLEALLQANDQVRGVLERHAEFTAGPAAAAAEDPALAAALAASLADQPPPAPEPSLLDLDVPAAGAAAGAAAAAAPAPAIAPPAAVLAAAEPVPAAAAAPAPAPAPLPAPMIAPPAAVLAAAEGGSGAVPADDPEDEFAALAMRRSPAPAPAPASAGSVANDLAGLNFAAPAPAPAPMAAMTAPIAAPAFQAPMQVPMQAPMQAPVQVPMQAPMPVNMTAPLPAAAISAMGAPAAPAAAAAAAAAAVPAPAPAPAADAFAGLLPAGGLAAAAPVPAAAPAGPPAAVLAAAEGGSGGANPFDLAEGQGQGQAGNPFA